MTRKYTKEEKVARRSQHDTSRFKIKQTRDEKGICVPTYKLYTSHVENAPVWEVLNNTDNAGKVYMVKDSIGNLVPISVEWLTGFMDGEGTFTFHLNRNDTMSLGFQIQAAFIIVQGEADYHLLTAIANFLGVGTVNVNHTDKTSTRYQLRIVNPVHLVSIIIPLFNIVKLRTKKKDEFLIWAKLTQDMLNNKHKQNWPHNMFNFIDGLRELKYVGAPTDHALDFLSTCNDLENNVKASRY